MAAQDTLSNFFAGIFILIDQPFREGDELMLETGEVTRVEAIGLRTTKLFHFQNNQQIIMPNNELATKRIINMSYPEATYRMVLPIGVAYSSDLKKVHQVLMDVVAANQEVLKDEQHKPVVYLKEFGDSSINFQVRVFVANSRARNPVLTALNYSIKEAFDREGIEIPFPQRDVWFKNALGKAPDAPGDA
jgi:small-conductance mechanosensitive channel